MDVTAVVGFVALVRGSKNKQFLELAHDEIEAQILLMPKRYNSVDFYSAFEQNYPREYADFLRIYTGRHHDQPHARQIVNSHLMHTVTECFHHLTRKVRTVANPKGGDMSEWTRG